MDVSTLRRIFHRAHLAALPSLVLATSTVACGGSVVVDNDDGGPKSDTGGSTDTLPPPADTPATCRVSPRPEPIPPCGYTVNVIGDPRACGIDPFDAGPSSNLPPSTCQVLCGSTTINYCYFMPESLQLECGGFCEGRRPEGLEAACVDDGAAIGRWFARSAYLEAASVDAFRILKRELAAHRAPSLLVRGCSRAARDEVKHARVTTALARRHRVRAPKPEVGRRATRSLEAIAIENAIEGCVRETFGAMLAGTQALEARDPVVRAAMKRIARDETRHAALSWSLDAWIRGRLSPDARARVEEARQKAVDELRTETARARRDAVTDELGVPRTPRALAMLTEIERAIWRM
jgi:hypothetical protein